MKMRFLAVLLASSALAAAPLAAQDVAPRSRTGGFQLGVHLSGSSLTTEEFEEDGEEFRIAENDGSGGLGLMLGYGFGRLFTLYVNVDAAGGDNEELGGEYALAHVDLGGRFHFGSERNALVPYADVALTGVGLGFADGDATLGGGGVSVGGGVQYFLSPRLALDGNLKLTFGSFTELTVEEETIEFDDFGYSTARINLGIVWRP